MSNEIHTYIYKYIYIYIYIYVYIYICFNNEISNILYTNHYN